MSDEALRRLERSAAHGAREDRLRYALELERRGILAGAIDVLAPATVAYAEAIAALAEAIERPLRGAVRAEAAALLSSLGRGDRARELAHAAIEAARSGRDVLEKGWPRARAAATLAREGEWEVAGSELRAVLALVPEGGGGAPECAALLGRWFQSLALARPALGRAGASLADAGLARLVSLRSFQQVEVLGLAAGALPSLGLEERARGLARRQLDDLLGRDLDKARGVLASLVALGVPVDAELGGRILAAIESRAGDADDHVGPALALVGLRPLPRPTRVAREIAQRLVAAEEHEAAASVRLAALTLAAEQTDEDVKADHAERLEVELRWAWERLEHDEQDVHVEQVLARAPGLVDLDRALEILDEAVANADLVPAAARGRILTTVFEAATRLPREPEIEEAALRWAEVALAGARRFPIAESGLAAALRCVRALEVPASLVAFVEEAARLGERALAHGVPGGDADAERAGACEVLLAAARAGVRGGRRALAGPLVRTALAETTAGRGALGGPGLKAPAARTVVAQAFGVAGELEGPERYALATEVVAAAERIPQLVLRGGELTAARSIAALVEEVLAPAVRVATEDPELGVLRVGRAAG